jgi:hypothetical protein
MRSTIVTNDAMTVMKAGILTLSGMNLDNNEITTLEPTRTNVVAMPIPRPFSDDEVVASVGHVPNTNIRIGFSLKKPLVKFCIWFI